MKLLLSSIFLIVAFASCKKEAAPETDQRILVKYEIVATAKIASPSYVYFTDSPGRESSIFMSPTDSVWSFDAKFSKGTKIKFESSLALVGNDKSFVSSVYFNGVKKATMVPSSTVNVNNTSRGAAKIEIVVE